jgi:hypothetical protein
MAMSFKFSIADLFNPMLLTDSQRSGLSAPFAQKALFWHFLSLHRLFYNMNIKALPFMLRSVSRNIIHQILLLTTTEISDG